MSEVVVPLTVEAADILPIIKRFMYAEREVFLRELISNGIDALSKNAYENPADLADKNRLWPGRHTQAISRTSSGN